MAELQLGPTVMVEKSCRNCTACRSDSYKVQSDSGHDVYCTHPAVGEKRIGDTTWATPKWCPADHSSAPLTDEQINAVIASSEVYEYHPGATHELVRAVERAHGIV